jgi:hypothetical protein
MRENRKWKHHYLDEDEKNKFKELVKNVEEKHPLFLWMKKQENVSKWPKFIGFLNLILFLYTIYWRHCHGSNYDDDRQISATLFWSLMFGSSLVGMIRLSINFVATHVSSHSLFLCYPEHSLPLLPSPGEAEEKNKEDKIMIRVDLQKEINNQLPIYFYAFYHHHHKKNKRGPEAGANVSNGNKLTDYNWIPEMSDHDIEDKNIFEHDGTRNIMVAHWHGYSMLTSFKKFFVTFWMILLTCYFSSYLSPCWSTILILSTLYNILGYENASLALPLAHGRQHIHSRRFGETLSTIFDFLENLGIVATKNVHLNHHVHTGEFVYQDFSSSGFYFMSKLDPMINKFWNRKFSEAVTLSNEATLKETKEIVPYDFISPLPTNISFASVFLPLLSTIPTLFLL